MYAGLQATLHNAHFVRDKGEPAFSAAMFMPGYKATVDPAAFDWRGEQAKMKLFAGSETPEAKKAKRAENRFLQACYKERAQLMDEARARGASSAELQLIMEG